MMDIRLPRLALVAVLALPVLAHARPVTVSTQLAAYKGNRAYLALYVTDANGKYQRTLWVAGKKAKYFKHLPDWARGSGLQPAAYDGLSGASVTSGGTLKTTVDIADELIDAGYQIRIDSAVEDKRDNRAEVIVPLTTDGAGKPVPGKVYVKSFTYSF